MSNDARESLKAYIAKHGLKSSRQREVIADVFFEAKGHVSIDELLDAVRKIDARVGQATVYRTMKLLLRSGLAEARQFGDGHTRYEASLEGHAHHDHLICTSCGRIFEFQNAQIETLQDRIAQKHGFLVTHHKMELYGLCSSCQGTRTKNGERA